MTFASDRLTFILFAAGSAVLALHPLIWLARTWTAPAYASEGYVYAIAVLALAARSVLSGPATAPGDQRLMFGLLILAAALRLLSQILAINLVGGFALAIDVYALGRLLALERRPSPVSPFWLAVLFLFSLPLETVLERLVGFPLQMVSASLACRMLGWIYPETICSGVRIEIGAQDVLVDLPCSGASGLLLLLALFVGITALRRPRFAVAVLWGAAVLGLAAAGNALRISLLAAGLVKGLDVMAEPAHTAIGLATLALVALPLALIYKPDARPARLAVNPRPLPRLLRLPSAALCFVLSLWIIAQPAQPVDVSTPVAPRPLPASIGGQIGRQAPLSPLEIGYFRAYGGVATKVQYGPLGVNRVSTTSPLRHLHSPDACLRGLGFDVQFLGTRFDRVPSSVYRATAPDGRAFLVSVSYVSDTGDVTASVAEAIWHWLNGRGDTWSSVQRITPLTLDDAARSDMDAAVLVALDIPITQEL
ncbi:MAG: exosortase T [Rhodobacteraceae bacterium]|nr:exosortase T [Paracoccaceae bacterium]